MTKETEELSRERHLVVVFDICSSTTILEDLKRTDNLGAWRNLLISLKDYVLEKGAPLGMDLYKFIGDGWVLLFPNSVPKMELCAFLGELSKRFEVRFEASIKPLLSQEPSPIGLMFGIDAGELIRMVLGNQVEYVGRAINVASRLQSYTKELPGGPAYKVIFSKNSFNSPAPPPTDLTVEPIKVSLRNISPPTMQCFAWQTTDAMPAKATSTAAVVPVESLKTVRTESPSLTDAKLQKVTSSRPVMPVESPKAARAEPAPPAAAAIPGLNIKVTDVRPIQMAALGALGKWMSHRTGQPGIVAQFTNEAQKGAQSNASAVANAHLIYRDGEKELLRVRGAWLDGFDVVKFNANDTRSLIVGVSGDKGFYTLEAVRTTVNGSERVEIRPSRFAPIPPKLTVLVQLTDANGRDVLYEGEFAIGTNPLTIARMP